MDVRPGYKRTEVGVIPVDWNVASLGQQLRKAPSYGINAPAIPFDFRSPTYLRITDITEDGRFSEAAKASVEHPASSEYLLERGDIVLARTGASVGKSYLYDLSDGPLVFAGFLIRVSANPERLAPAFLKYFLQSHPYWNWVKVNSMRSGQPGINGREYANLPLPLPPIKAEQEAIVESLSDADALIKSLEQLLDKKRQIMQGAMQTLLAGKKRLPGCDVQWEETELGAIAERIVGGGTPSRSVSAFWGGEVPWMTVKDFADHNPHGTIESITKDGLAHSASHLIPSGTLITSTRMALGKAVVFDVDVAINQDLKAIFPVKDVSPQFLRFWFKKNEKSIAELGSGSTVMGLSLPELRKISFSKPPLTEQTAIAAVLTDMETEIAALDARLAKARQLKQGMMQMLLTGKVRLLPSTQSGGAEPC